MSQIQKVSAQHELNKFATGGIRGADLQRKQSSGIAETAQTKLAATAVVPVDSCGRTIFVADAHRKEIERFVVRAD